MQAVGSRILRLRRKFYCFLERSHLAGNKRVDAYGVCDLRVRGVAVS